MPEAPNSLGLADELTSHTISRRTFLKIALAVGGGSLFPRWITAAEIQGLPKPEIPPKPIQPQQTVISVMPDFSADDFNARKLPSEEITKFEDAIGARTHVVSVFVDMDRKPINPNIIDKISQSGRAAMLNWEPRSYADPLDHARRFTAAAFTSGQHDSPLESWAKMIRDSGVAVYLRLGYEMNGNWFPWGQKPEPFKTIWKHVVDKFKSAGADNARWIFSPNHWPSPEKIADYYPGDEYVDVVGADAYDKYSIYWKNAWHWTQLNFPPEALFNHINYYLKQVAPHKPLMVCEIGSGRESGRDDWLAAAIFKCLQQGITGLNYFQYLKETDWRLTDPAQLKTLRTITGSRYFLSDTASLSDIDSTLLKVW